jgi:diaminohydroxyphosphoribosylaminopyrimidine deaminase/5-amino-6-(5-phosphoribosylamino)uracil reductase
MLRAIALSRQGFGHTAPNPCVGALLVKDGLVLAEGWHKAFGGAHAEVEALQDAARKDVNPAECSLVVTLEPCSHYGKTPPCTKAVLDAGIRHVVVGARDHNPKAAGGAEVLREQGVLVECGIAEQECRDNIADFLVWQTSSRPYIILKLASTLDGRIATRNGHSKWISCAETLTRVHELRSKVQAIMVGGNTFYADNPALTCRLEHRAFSAHVAPLAVIITRRLPDNPGSFTLLQDRPQDVIFLTDTAQSESVAAKNLQSMGVSIWGAEGDYLAEGITRLRRERQAHYLLCEGGGRLGLSLLKNKLADELRLHMSPKIIGDAEARPLFDGLQPESMTEALGLRFTGSEFCGDDLLLQLRRC